MSSSSASGSGPGGDSGSDEGRGSMQSIACGFYNAFSKWQWQFPLCLKQVVVAFKRFVSTMSSASGSGSGGVHSIARTSQTLGLRVAPWKSDYIAYNYAAFVGKYGDGAWDIWSNSAKVTDRNCNWRVCWVRLGEEIRKCPVAKLRTCGSSPINTLLELCHCSSTEIECFIDLNDIAGTTNERSAKKVLDYFVDDPCSWRLDANSGELDLVDRLDIIHLQWLVPDHCWWSWYNARHYNGAIPLRREPSGTPFDSMTNSIILDIIRQQQHHQLHHTYIVGR